MKQLIKQIFKSLKSSLLLILSLIFISFCIIFVSSSSLFINQNLNNSVNTLRTEGNSADVIIDKKYNSSDITYTHSAPVSKQVRVSNYTYKPTTGKRLENVIFPYQASDFTNPNINAEWILKPGEVAPPYYDRYLPRYAARKFGMFRAGVGINETVPASPASLLGSGKWYGIGYSMTNHATGEKLFDPKYFVFDEKMIGTQANLIGYFDDGSIVNEIDLAESAMGTKNTNFTYATNQGIATNQGLLDNIAESFHTNS
ncbi:MAG: hypothetical protein RSC65_02780, partial [Malacoplasma sp.]